MDLPDWLIPTPTDRMYPGTEPVGNLECSRCLRWIDDREIPIWFWSDNQQYCWRYHPSCLGLKLDIEPDNEDEWDEIADIDPPEVEMRDFGPCCTCRKDDGTAKYLVCLPQRTTEPGTGWGCPVCYLREDGAIAILCETCFLSGNDILDAIDGSLLDKDRIERIHLSQKRFWHDESRHDVEE